MHSRAEIVGFLLLSVLSLLASFSHAESRLLAAQDAFSFSVQSSSAETAILSWKIQPGYYLYQHKFTVQQNQQQLPLNLPKAQKQFDENYGHSQVYYDQVNLQIHTQPKQSYQVMWQGCAKDRICYPPQHIEFQTDAEGLVTQPNPAVSQNQLFPTERSTLPAAADTELRTQVPVPTSDDVIAPQPVAAASFFSSALTDSANQFSLDQTWTQQLQQHSFGYGVLLFVGLGILLAFTPCSLPMLPILTSLIVRDTKGLKAWLVALVFVLSMATVYALLGMLAARAGLNFQRWLQQPMTLILFAALFVVFACNLFGLFELKMPHRMMHHLDRIQAVQQGGTLLGAGVMGMLSALLVGPCMTAPLAGALLFISQTQDQSRGAILLFSLGLGMGIPLLLASFLSSKFLPKAGQWMHEIKVIFAFIMLGLSLYFLRPLLSETTMQWGSLLLGLSFISFLLYRLATFKSKIRWFYLLLLSVFVPVLVWSQMQQRQHAQAIVAGQKVQWHVARTQQQFEQLLAAAPANHGIVIDVYADWCVACQPIEHHILQDAKVQRALQPLYLIKLDLSQYDASHQALLNQWQILGPPTYLFLNAKRQELRQLRLTGAFTRIQLLQQLRRM